MTRPCPFAAVRAPAERESIWQLGVDLPISRASPTRFARFPAGVYSLLIIERWRKAGLSYLFLARLMSIMFETARSPDETSCGCSIAVMAA